jgi:hypothetical protein
MSYWLSNIEETIQHINCTNLHQEPTHSIKPSTYQAINQPYSHHLWYHSTPTPHNRKPNNPSKWSLSSPFLRQQRPLSNSRDPKSQVTKKVGIGGTAPSGRWAQYNAHYVRLPFHTSPPRIANVLFSTHRKPKLHTQTLRRTSSERTGTENGR